MIGQGLGYVKTGVGRDEIQLKDEGPVEKNHHGL